ncbi:hypothetical protein HYC85_030923 [Camellia sinensis]|uniref:Uncharacterized protein n=1 Tax=Camellia sinensis TaxID=4442 RepID=A0A7J7FPG5_CAMSI|nr:hypothetical protein HYC85_030923 [Camellia sinensis]
MVDLNMMMKRGKIAGKAIHNLMFHHHHSSTFNRQSHDRHLSFSAPHDEAGSSVLPGFLQSPMMVHDMLYSELSSPALPGFGLSPMVRQLRITDSPFPLRDVDRDSHVDEAAGEFIAKFYNDLRKQNTVAIVIC